MIEFIEALIGLTYHGAKAVGSAMDRAVTNRCASELDRFRSVLQCYDEPRLRTEFYSNKNKCLNSMPEQDIEYIFGKKWRQYVEEDRWPQPGGIYFNGITDVLYNLWLSYRGVVPSAHILGYNAQMYLPTLEKTRSRSDVANRFFQTVEANLQKAHPSEQIFFVRRVDDPNDIDFNFRAKYVKASYKPLL